MANEFFAGRVAYGNVTIPANVLADTASTLSVAVGPYVPTGAIITGITYLAGALTAMSNMKNGTINVAVGTQIFGANNAIGSVVLVAGSVYNQTLTASVGLTPIVSTGGPLQVNFASSDATRSGISGTFDVYVGYIKG